MSVITLNVKNIIVNVVDSNISRITAWNDDDLKELPIFEPGLDQIIYETRNKIYFFRQMSKKIFQMLIYFYICKYTHQN